MRILNKTLDTLLFLILAAMSGVVASNVFFRFILHRSLYWGDELAQVLMVWLTFLGAAVAMREYAHYAFDYFARKLMGRAQRLFLITGRSITMITVIILLIYSTKVTIGIREWIMPAMEYSRGWVYGACPAGCLFMLVYGIRDLIIIIKN